MNTKLLLLLLAAFQLFSVPAVAQLTVSVTPGYRFNSGEKWSNEKLNRLGQPIVSVAGTVTGSSLAAGGVQAVHLSTNAADQITIRGGYDGSTTTNLQVNFNTNSLAIVAGQLGVKTNSIDVELATNYVNLTHLLTNWLDAASVLTNLPVTLNTNNAPYTNTFILIGTSYNVGTNGAPTNTTFKITPLSTLQAAAVYSALNTNLINTLASNLLASPFVSTNTNALAAGLVTFVHGLGVKPRQVTASLLCVTNDGIFSTNQELAVESAFPTGSSFPNYTVRYDVTNIFITGYGVPRVVTNASDLMDLTANRWRLKVIATP